MDQLVSKTTATTAKDIGFNEECDIFFNSFYPSGVTNINGLTNYDDVTGKRNDFTSLPTQTQLQKWLREKHEIHMEPKLASFNDKYAKHYKVEVYNIINENEVDLVRESTSSTSGLRTYEEALERGIELGLNRLINGN